MREVEAESLSAVTRFPSACRPSDEATAFWTHLDRVSGPEWCQTYMQSVDQPHRQVILGCLHALPRFETVLEVGCHAGPNLRLMRTAFPEVRLAGIELSEQATACARRMFLGDDHVIIHQGNLLDWLPRLPSDSVDVLLSCYTLAYVAPEDLPALAAEMLRVARVGIVLAEPMGWVTRHGGRVAGLHYAEWVHDYFGLFWSLVGRRNGATFTSWIVRPPVDRLDGVLTIRLATTPTPVETGSDRRGSP